jgi:alkylation response protein AidB-like acyl-CoA dehydrogenase
MLADVATNLSAADLLFTAAASKLDRGERAPIEAAHAKKFATKSSVERCRSIYAA